MHHRWRDRARRLGILSLGLAALLQGGILLERFRTSTAEATDLGNSATQLRIGDTVTVLKGALVDADGGSVPLAGSGATLVLAYHSECVHCDAVADEWRRWLETAQGVSVLAVTRDGPERARSYERSHGWEVSTLSVAGAPPSSREMLLVSRTPWLFVFDSSGVLVYEGHGSNLDEVRDLGHIDQ